MLSQTVEVMRFDAELLAQVYGQITQRHVLTAIAYDGLVDRDYRGQSAYQLEVVYIHAARAAHWAAIYLAFNHE